jgi:hypothetical protein
MRILDCCRHNMTKTRNKIPAKINDFTVPGTTILWGETTVTSCESNLTTVLGMGITLPNSWMQDCQTRTNKINDLVSRNMMEYKALVAEHSTWKLCLLHQGPLIQPTTASILNTGEVQWWKTDILELIAWFQPCVFLLYGQVLQTEQAGLILSATNTYSESSVCGK